MRRAFLVAAACGLLMSAAAPAATIDPDNPSCPTQLNWSTYRQMKFTLEPVDGKRILKAEGMIDDGVAARLQDALKANAPIDEIWIRSPGGNARAGNEAGKVVRAAGIPTRIPNGWACFSACNFLFMGGVVRYVDSNGLFIVHMFTFTSNREAIRQATNSGERGTVGLIGDIEQQSALLASEDNNFLIRMGISRNLLTEVMYRQSAVQDGQNRSTRRCLTQEEVNRYNVATVPWRGR